MSRPCVFCRVPIRGERTLELEVEGGSRLSARAVICERCAETAAETAARSYGARVEWRLLLWPLRRPIAGGSVSLGPPAELSRGSFESTSTDSSELERKPRQ
jgi:hypothetical protein